MKGKNAAQAANRRLAEAQTRITELEAARQVEVKAAKEREHQLTTELNQLRGDLVHRVKVASAERIQEAFDKGAADLAAAHEDFNDRIRRSAQYIGSNGELQLTARGFVELSRILGPQLGQLLVWAGKLPDNAHSRGWSRSQAALVIAQSADKGIDNAAAEGLGRIMKRAKVQ